MSATPLAPMSLSRSACAPATFARHCVGLAALALTLWALPAAGATIVSVSGGDGSTGISIGPNGDAQAVAIEFSLSQSLSAFTLSATAFCVNCQGAFWLQANRLGPTASIGDLIDILQVTSSFGLLGDPLTVFSGSLLEAGNYFMVFSVTSGTGGWQTAAPPVVTEQDGGEVWFSYAADSLSPVATRSAFNINLSRSELPEFSLVGTLQGPAHAVPEPSSAALVLGGLAAAAGLSSFVTRRRSSAVDRRSHT